MILINFQHISFMSKLTFLHIYIYCDFTASTLTNDCVSQDKYKTTRCIIGRVRMYATEYSHILPYNYIGKFWRGRNQTSMHHHIIMCGVLGGFSGASNTHSFTKSIYHCFEILRCTNIGPTSSYLNNFSCKTQL